MTVATLMYPATLDGYPLEDNGSVCIESLGSLQSAMFLGFRGGWLTCPRSRPHSILLHPIRRQPRHLRK